MDELLSEFIAETRETLESLAGEIVAWEAAPNERAHLDTIFRFVHTVKGSCGFLDLPRLERLSHAAEDVLADVRGGRRVPDAALVSAVLSIVDRIGELTDAIESGESLDDGDDQPLIAALAPGAVAEAPALPVASQPITARAVARSIRLPVELLDRMMAGVSDMVLARNELSRRLRESGLDSGVEVSFERLSGCVAEMRDAITRTRMARIDNLFLALPRMVRDLSAELGKAVTLDIDGGDVELDREMIEMIRDPLTHIVRNAIDHGIEAPQDRQAAGKPVSGRLHVGARQAGNQILIEVEDDGRGIDADRLVQRAIASRVITAEQAEGLSWTSKLELIFEAGISTAREVTAVSGRGVGMDVVRANVVRIGGVVDIDSKPGSGLRLTMRVPLTLTIIPALTVSGGDQHFAIPRSAIDEIIRGNADAVRMESIGGATMACIRGQRLPLVTLGTLLGKPRDIAPERMILVVLRRAGGDRYVLAVDAVHDHEELVVKPAAPAVMAAGIYAGTTLPDNSRPMLLLDVAGLADRAGIIDDDGLAAASVEEQAGERDIANGSPTLLFRDLDGAERGLRLALVERIEDVPAHSVAVMAGRPRLSHDGIIMPLFGCGSDIGRERVRILRMNDGHAQLAYAIDSVIDIVTTMDEIMPAPVAGMIAGVALIDGRPVEMIDPYWLFGEAASAGTGGRKALCLLADEHDPWTRQVLAPLIAAAGYQVAFPGDPHAETADVVIRSDEAAEAHGPALAEAAPVVQLRTHRDGGEDGSIYRYDRFGLIAALDGRTANRRAG